MTEITRNPWKVLDDYRGKVFTGEWPTLPELFEISAQRFGARACFTIYDPGRVSLSYLRAQAAIRKLAAHIAGLGIPNGSKIAVTGKNSPEWAVTYLAILASGCVVVPLDHQLKIDEASNLIKASDAVLLFCDEEKFDLIDEKALGLKAKYCLSREMKPYVYDLEGIWDEGLMKARAARESDLAAILYTSGTTGNPKGVCLTHANLVTDCFMAQSNLSIFHTDVFYALLPIHHSYTMLAVFIEAISVGAEVVFAKRMAIMQILKDFKEAKVTMFLGVPLLFNKLLTGIMNKVKAKGPLVYGLVRSLMFISGIIKKSTGVNPGKKMFKSILDAAGLSTIRICISGGGPLAPSVFADYNRLGIDFVQGYGLTETSPIIALNPKERYKPESVGRVVANTQIKIIDPDERGNGELVVKGPMVMQGYYRNEAATKAVFTEDGWFKTGDVGRLDDEDYVYLTGRAKNMIVTEGGKNVYPEEIENAFQLYDEIEQVMVRGYVADKAARVEGIEALIFPAKDFFEQTIGKGAAEIGKGATALKDAIAAKIKAIIAEVNAKLLPYQRITKTTILEEALDMTSTKKVKRFSVREKVS
jgi:long-chain acyl-CoA synthetase